MHARTICSRALRLVGVASAAALVVAAPVHAQGSSTSYSIGANAGLVIPVSDLGDFTSSGYTIAATLGMHQSLAPISFRVEGSFTELPWKDNLAQNAKRRIYGFALDGMFNLGTASSNGGLYLTGGLGYFGSKDSDFQTPFGSAETSTNWDIGLNAGLGYYLPLRGFTVYFEGRYRNVFSNTNQVMFPITVGVAF
jgi:outer membrane protein with beta-barrel domain